MALTSAKKRPMPRVIGRPRMVNSRTSGSVTRGILGRYFACSSVLAVLCLSATTLARAEASFSTVYQAVRPSVVYVVAALPNGAASGSGFIYKSDASTTQVVTANHVIEGATAIDVILDS